MAVSGPSNGLPTKPGSPFCYPVPACGNSLQFSLSSPGIFLVNFVTDTPLPVLESAPQWLLKCSQEHPANHDCHSGGSFHLDPSPTAAFRPFSILWSHPHTQIEPHINVDVQPVIPPDFPYPDPTVLEDFLISCKYVGHT